ncbi:hypothetical protein N480_25435 [Pseudoalteromonas luteoviolacea S2607]|uniref:hypothetical protein n=1 Tax=Pseudoalteromonas luteoviolacea TaxID=43657 RepID=UPI0007B0585B|nr:hypothetical protein [Pseudoalteromonas luteoviolacea]KZN32595.1 hypothetical protein N480_25435 [Pseudoalteromonas luteoviolacea S2607]
MNKVKYEQLLLSSLNNEDELHSESFEYQSIFLSSVQPDPTNGRFLPSILIDDEHAKLFCARKLTKHQLVQIYHGENHVLIGKSCIVNCLKYGTEQWKKANQTIESIIELGDNISVAEMIQAPTIYPVENNKYQLLTGHRRFFALVYANGYGSTAQFKLYERKPLLSKVKQFQENASREELPQYGKLQAFLNALSEIEALNGAKLSLGLKKLTVKETATVLGISMGAYDNYNVLTRYPSVLEAYESGLSLPFLRVKKIVLSTEVEYKNKNNKTVLNVTDKKAISELIYLQLTDKKAQAKKVHMARPIKIKPINSLSSLRVLLTSNITELDTDVDWTRVDWNDQDCVSDALAKTIDFLNHKDSD